MAASLVRWLESYEFSMQLLVLVCIFDPLGAILGYLAHPLLGVDPLVGVTLGLVAASTAPGLWIVRHSMKADADDTGTA